MEFQKIESTEAVVDYLAQAIKSHLAGAGRLLWLIPGGSAIAIAAQVSKRLYGVDLRHLTVTLTDERYGPVGHADSNWLQLAEAGLTLPRAQLLLVLDGQEMASTTQRFAANLSDIFRNTDYRLGLFGIGADGHIAGVLPGSPAIDSAELAASYDAGEFQRITVTPRAISRLDEVVVYAVGEAKRETLKKLYHDHTLAEQPAQVLKKVPKVTIFNDQIGDSK